MKLFPDRGLISFRSWDLHRITDIMRCFYFYNAKCSVVLSAALLHQSQQLQLPRLLLSADLGVDSGGIDVGMSQQIRKVGQILVLPVVCTGKQVPQIMGEYL